MKALFGFFAISILFASVSAPPALANTPGPKPIKYYWGRASDQTVACFAQGPDYETLYHGKSVDPSNCPGKPLISYSWEVTPEGDLACVATFDKDMEILYNYEAVDPKLCSHKEFPISVAWEKGDDGDLHCVAHHKYDYEPLYNGKPVADAFCEFGAPTTYGDYGNESPELRDLAIRLERSKTMLSGIMADTQALKERLPLALQADAIQKEMKGRPVIQTWGYVQPPKEKADATTCTSAK